MARLSLALSSLALVVLVAANCSNEPDEIEPGTGGRLVIPQGGAAGAGLAGGEQGGSSAGDGGSTSEGGSAGAETAGNNGSGAGGSDAGAGGSDAGAGGSDAGSGGNAGSDAGSGGSNAGSGGATGGSSGSSGQGGGGTAGSGQGGSGCEDTNPALDVTLDTFNVALAGNFIPYEKERRQPIVDALAKLDSDIVCLQEVWEQSDKDLIADAVKAKFPHTFSVKHDLNTPLDDATDANGATPTPPTTPPCDDTDAAGTVAKFDAAVDCLKTNCPNDAGLGEQGETISSACATSKCASKALSLLNTSKRCYGCLLPQMPTSTFENMRTECKSNPKAGLAFGGQNGVMILSKHPLSETGAVVLPGTWNRRVLLRAKATLPNGSDLQVYCHHLTPIFKGTLYPYTGLYGAGPDANGWANEQILHAKKLVELAKKDAACTPTVFMADTNASRSFPDSTPPVLAESPATLDTIETLFTPGLAAGYTPACTYCKANENVADNDTGADQWLDYIYLLNIPASKVKSTTRTFLDPVVDVTVQGSGGAGGSTSLKTELSDHYGLRSVVTIGK